VSRGTFLWLPKWTVLKDECVTDGNITSKNQCTLAALA
jgi:putative intracellular protease/amidase